MKPWRQWFVVGTVVLSSCFPGVVLAASEVDILLDKLVDKGILTNLEAGDIRREISGTKEERNTQLAKEIVPESARNWKWGGDLRLRDDYRNRTGSGTSVNRQRIRFRYGFNAQVSDALNVGARLATGNTTDPTSTNQSFDTVFNHKVLVLDRAFATYSPQIPGLADLTVTGGIIENPFWVVGPLVWDDEVNFDGAAVHLAKEFGPVTLFTTNGIFPLETGITEAATLWSAQGGAVFKPFPEADQETLKHLTLTGALAYHDYMNVTNPVSEQPNGGSVTTSVISTAGGAKGNTAGVADFNLLNPTLELASQYEEVPFALFGDLVHNTSLASSNNNGFMLGVKVGKARIPFDLVKGWEAGYFFERLEPDATFGPFTDGDFGNGGTNHRGHAWWVQLATLKNSSVQLKYYNTQELEGSKNHADTFQADWVTTF